MVTDALKSTSFKDVILTVCGGIVTNISPTVSAGSDRELVLPLTGLTLYGSASDVDGKIASYKWSQIDGTKSAFND